MILAATYFADGTTARCDKSYDEIPHAQQMDWQKFAPNVMPGDLIATKFNPLLLQAI